MSWLGWLELKVKRCSRAALNPTPRCKLSLFLFSLLFLFLFPFPSLPFPSFPFLSLSFPLFVLILSFCFLLGVGFGAAWQRRFLCFLCFLCFLFPAFVCFAFSFRFLCFQLLLSFWPLFFASASGSSISSPLFILSSISSVQGSVLTLAAMAFSCRHWVRVMVRLSMW